MKTIIPVASGKGGVGKTFLSANLADILARQGKKVIAVDLDLGASNLHTALGISPRNSGVGDFLKKKLPSLTNLLLPTHNSNLKIITGDNSMPFMANIPQAQKNRLIKSIYELPADYIILDLGAGSSFLALNFFTMSRNGIMLTTTDPNSIFNFLTFLKNLFFKIITSLVKHNNEIYTEVIEHIRNSSREKKITVDYLLGIIKRKDRVLSDKVKNIIRSFKPSIVLNMADNVDDLLEFEKIQKIIRENLSIDINFAGLIDYDNEIRKSSISRKLLAEFAPENFALKSIEKIASRIHNGFGQNLFELIDAEKKDRELFYKDYN